MNHHIRNCLFMSTLLALPMLPQEAPPGQSGIAQLSLPAQLRSEVDVLATRIVPSAPIGDSFTVEVEMKNVSRRPIYAVGVACTMQYVDGRSETTDRIFDLLDLYLNATYASASDMRLVHLFRSGEEYKATFRLPSRGGAFPILASAAVEMLVFDDKTAIGADTLVLRLSTNRKIRSQGYGTLVNQLRAVGEKRDWVAALSDLRKTTRANVGSGSTDRSRWTIIRGADGKEESRIDFSPFLADELDLVEHAVRNGSRLEVIIAQYERIAQTAAVHADLLREKHQ